MLNRIILQGRLGADPELRTTNTGTEVATVNIAVDRDKKSPDGERKADWFTVVAWRKTAEFLTRYFTKGSTVIVEGRLQMRSYTDRDGNKRSAAEVIADSIYFGDTKRDERNRQNDKPQAREERNRESEEPQAVEFSDLMDDNELPF